ncbi:Por secretion system C-terminal sorting domain-containing protein [Aquimarina amphilecti]|uniref:Por secretion system C-terminal sorting domain-containing protein n=1 Tax=Aquimarina amphilecti TaxID=1038014 RepID=A0A1H7JNL0_AQUAM|nr:T9SS type A sorting domain-containing protein [Aquimarina amphilecti]SEK75045.1 Por secretion system C-terminal sorting domain-containing protein [Aquimarina amphilecti]
MNSTLQHLKRGFCACAVVLTTFSATSQVQQLKTTADEKPNKGHQLYKQTKMFDSKKGSTDAKTPLERQADNAIERSQFELMRLKNPVTGKIPDGIRKAELQFSEKINISDESQKSLQTAAKSSRFSFWKNRGPFNVGGRTRALAIDSRNENVILAGGVSGGLWRTENAGETWRKVTRSFQDPSITGIVQDPRPRHSFTWYYISGERYGNSASAGGAFYQGSGVYKSRDGGRTFELLRATANPDVGIFNANEPFDLINSIAIDPTNGDIYLGTITGIQRSQDGGNSFTEVLTGGFDSKAEVAISSTGQIYATVDSDTDPTAGFFTSTDGDTWTNITPEGFVPAYGRTVMGIDPSNENTVYFLTQNNSGGIPALLNRYDLAAGTWTDLSVNLPFGIGGSVGNLNLQGEYNMIVKVHPTDSDLVFVAGTNVYRSTTGFTTPAGQESWVAGYSPLNNVSLYTNQHPDQHALLFFPSNPNKVLSGNDGGVYVTEDITATNDGVEPVAWTSLNNGYITTQPYHVAFDPEPNTDDLVAGFQDNGTWFTNSTDSNAIWESDFGGDGAYSAIADNGRTRYVSSQRGNVFRFNFDEEGVFESFSAVEPAGASGFAFVNPFILDPNNDNIMYMPAGSSIWRNNDLDGLPLFTNTNATENWVNLTNTSTPDGSTITSLDVSKFPVANRLYYGTNSGTVFRMDNANIDGQQAIDISTGKGLPVGFVNDINVDPSNVDRVIITLSNYGIPSVFITEDGGDSWTNISGNLEENADGSGNGPSVRSTAFLGSSAGRFGARLQRVFAATSTGLYSTRRLNGQNTVWRKENFAIGNSVTDEVVTRKDGFIAVAAHGSGLFSARFPVNANPLPESNLITAFLLDDFGVNENSEETTIDITGLFVQSQGLPIDIELTNSSPELVTATLLGNTLTLSYAPDSIGAASIGLIATSGEEQVAEGFTVTVSEPSIYEQTNTQVSTIPSQNFLDFNGLAQSADDFTVPAGNTWNIDRIVAFGAVNGSPVLNNVSIVIYENEGGVPGAEVYNSGEITPVSEPNISNLNIDLPEVVTLESGAYWISVYTNLAFDGGNQWFWASQDNVVGEVSQFRDPINLFGTGAIDWTATTVALGRDPLDQTFQIFGDIISSNEDLVEPELEVTLTTLDLVNEISVYPNPSNNTFFFNFGDAISKSSKNVNINIFNSTGNLVHTITDVNSNTNVNWDSSRLASGLYYAKISGTNTNTVVKLVKK